MDPLLADAAQPRIAALSYRAKDFEDMAWRSTAPKLVNDLPGRLAPVLQVFSQTRD
jgi:hypothetical protein